MSTTFCTEASSEFATIVTFKIFYLGLFLPCRHIIKTKIYSKTSHFITKIA